MAQNLEREWHSLMPPVGKTEYVFYDNRAVARKGVRGALGLKVRKGKGDYARAWFYEYRDADNKVRRRQLGKASEVSGGDKLTYRDACAKMDREAAGIQQQPPVWPHLTEAPVISFASSTLTVSNLIDSFRASLVDRDGNPLPKPNGKPYAANYIRNISYSLEIMRRRFGSRDAAELVDDGGREISAFLEQHRDRKHSKVLGAHMRAVFGFARATATIKSNPMAGLRIPGRSGKGERYLSDREIALLWPAALSAGYPGGHIVRLALLTGRRVDELCQAEWREFDLDAAVWTLPSERAKNDRTHQLPLTPEALALLRECWEKRRGAGRFVFHPDDREGAIHRSGQLIRVLITRLNDAIKPATEANREPEQQTPWTMHVLRHTVETMLADLGCPEEIRDAILNHVRKGVGARYNHSQALPIKREWLGKLEQHILGLVPLALPAPEAAYAS